MKSRINKGRSAQIRVLEPAPVKGSGSNIGRGKESLVKVAVSKAATVDSCDENGLAHLARLEAAIQKKGIPEISLAHLAPLEHDTLELGSESDCGTQVSTDKVVPLNLLTRKPSAISVYIHRLTEGEVVMSAFRVPNPETETK